MPINDGQLIDLVHSYDHLYNNKRSDFKDIVKKENSWREISLLLNYPVAEVQARWRYLREKYTREKRTLNTQPSGSAPKATWELMTNLSWLDHYLKKRRQLYNQPNQMNYHLHQKKEVGSLIIAKSLQEVGKSMKNAINAMTVVEKKETNYLNEDFEEIGRMVVLKLKRIKNCKRRKNLKKKIASVLFDFDTDSE
ncbi:hypothetical protein ABEB36_008706 [Hypothenemus hampei]|uniref:MADF domain-containing protein n=1 Tax=Hypothenemus hampei TaxID=57062 RepID=A0ABD1EN86_HYPHA